MVEKAPNINESPEAKIQRVKSEALSLLSDQGVSAAATFMKDIMMDSGNDDIFTPQQLTAILVYRMYENIGDGEITNEEMAEVINGSFENPDA